MSAQTSVYSIVDYLTARYTLDELYEEGKGGVHTRAVEIATKVYEMNEELKYELDREIGSAVFDRECSKYSVGNKFNAEFEPELPPETLVKKMLGQTAAYNYRSLVEKAEAAGIRLNHKDPYKLINKRRLNKIIRDLASFVESQTCRM